MPRTLLLLLGVVSNASTSSKRVQRASGPTFSDVRTLYDLATDPYEEHDLYGQPEFAEAQEALDKRMAYFAAEVAAPQPEVGLPTAQ